MIQISGELVETLQVLEDEGARHLPLQTTPEARKEEGERRKRIPLACGFDCAPSGTYDGGEYPWNNRRNRVNGRIVHSSSSYSDRLRREVTPSLEPLSPQVLHILVLHRSQPLTCPRSAMSTDFRSSKAMVISVAKGEFINMLTAM